MSQELIDRVIIGSAPTADTDPWGFKYRPAHHWSKDIQNTHMHRYKHTHVLETSIGKVQKNKSTTHT